MALGQRTSDRSQHCGDGRWSQVLSRRAIPLDCRPLQMLAAGKNEIQSANDVKWICVTSVGAFTIKTDNVPVILRLKAYRQPRRRRAPGCRGALMAASACRSNAAPSGASAAGRESARLSSGDEMNVCALKLPDARRVPLALLGGTGTRTPSAAAGVAERHRSSGLSGIRIACPECVL